MLDLAIPRAKGVVLAETGAAGLGFAKLSTRVLDLAIPRAKGVALAETGAAKLRMRRAVMAEGPWSSLMQPWWRSPRVCAMAVAVVGGGGGCRRVVVVVVARVAIVVVVVLCVVGSGGRVMGTTREGRSASSC